MRLVLVLNMLSSLNKDIIIIIIIIIGVIGHRRFHVYFSVNYRRPCLNALE